MLQKWSSKRPLEVLIQSQINFGSDIRLIAFSEEDCSSLRTIVGELEISTEIVLQKGAAYNRCSRCVTAVNEFIDKALKDPRWKGDGLDYDSLGH
jgi:hypothetical protein